MFKIAQFVAAEMALAKQVTALEELKNDPELKRELEFSKELDEVLAKYNFTRPRLHEFLNQQAAAANQAERKTTGSKGRQLSPTTKMKLWTNPHTNETVESARRDHFTLREWTAQYGLETVLTWAKPI
ncbi:hypothetical protein D3C84_380400 [compost metagenome]